MVGVGIGRQTADTDESGGTSRVQLALPGGELLGEIARLQQYGFASRPVSGSDHIVVFQGGDRSRGVSVASGHQTLRPTGLQPGETAVWSAGSIVWLKADGSIAITPQNGKVIVSGDLVVNGISFLQHIHGGVQTGSGSTGIPLA